MQALFSSAVPVLPATTTPGIWAAVPVPIAHDADHQVAIGMGDRCAERRRPAPRARSAGRSAWDGCPPLAIVAATIAICSGLASTSPWPMAVDPMSSSPLMSEAAGSVLSAAPGDAGG